MARDKLRELSAELHTEWRNWTKIVRLFVARREGRFRVSSEEYERLHRRLTEILGDLSRESTGEMRSFYGRLRTALGPWVTLESLSAADRSILQELLEYCDGAQRKLDRRAFYARQIRNGLCAAGALILVAALATLLSIQVEKCEVLDLPLTITYWGQSIYWSLAEASTHMKLVYLGGFTAFVGTLVVWFATRRY